MSSSAPPSKTIPTAILVVDGKNTNPVGMFTTSVLTELTIHNKKDKNTVYPSLPSQEYSSEGISFSTLIYAGWERGMNEEIQRLKGQVQVEKTKKYVRLGKIISKERLLLELTSCINTIFYEIRQNGANVINVDRLLQIIFQEISGAKQKIQYWLSLTKDEGKSQALQLIERNKCQKLFVMK